MMTMPIDLTTEQQNSVDFDGGDLLIKGVPGSGKSVVLMSRAVRFNRDAIQKNETCKILIMTYTKALIKYTRQLVTLADLNPNMIELYNIDKVVWDIYHYMRGYIQLIKDWDRPSIASAALQRHYEETKKNHRFYSIEPDFWADEFKWIKQKNIKTVEEYIKSERAGRGGKVRMSSEDKRTAFQIFTIYCSIMKEQKKLDREDLYIYVVDHADKIPAKYKYDYVLVDEAQDLSFIQLKFAKALASQSLTIAADKAQKIYKTSFSWKDLNIDINRNSSKTLHKSFRSTKQIVTLAESLQNVNRFVQDDTSDYTDPIIPEREGSLPEIICCVNAGEERDVVLSYVAQYILAENSIGVLYRSTTERYRLESWLRSKRISYQIHTDESFDVSMPGVKLCTLHSSKGLEFDCVIIPFFDSQTFPLSSALSEADEAQINDIKIQERSLLYVGMTRSKYDLIMTYSGLPSPFLSELDHDFYLYRTAQGQELQKPVFTGVTSSQLEEKKKNTNKSKSDAPDSQQAKQQIKHPDYVVGAVVKHKKFGIGTIIDRKGDLVEVKFREGKKRLGLDQCISYDYLTLEKKATADD